MLEGVCVHTCVHMCVRESVCVSEVKDDDPNTTVEMACMW